MRIPIALLAVLLALAASSSAPAQSLRDLLKDAGLETEQRRSSAPTNVDEPTAANGIRSALARGAEYAVNRLGRRDGFLGDEAVRIPLPGKLDRLADAARLLGQGKRVDALIVSMNRAAEAAVPEAAQILSEAVRGMSVRDALGIVSGGEAAGTQYFRDRTSDSLRERFLPIVAKHTSEAGVSRRYERLRDRTGGLAALGLEAPELDEYVTEKAMDGLFHYIGEQEKQIRRDPVGTGSDLLRRVFGG
jgi:hypothetical protein